MQTLAPKFGTTHATFNRQLGNHTETLKTMPYGGKPGEQIQDAAKDTNLLDYFGREYVMATAKQGTQSVGAQMRMESLSAQMLQARKDAAVNLEVTIDRMKKGIEQLGSLLTRVKAEQSALEVVHAIAQDS